MVPVYEHLCDRRLGVSLARSSQGIRLTERPGQRLWRHKGGIPGYVKTYGTPPARILDMRPDPVPDQD